MSAQIQNLLEFKEQSGLEHRTGLRDHHQVPHHFELLLDPGRFPWSLLHSFGIDKCGPGCCSTTACRKPEVDCSRAINCGTAPESTEDDNAPLTNEDERSCVTLRQCIMMDASKSSTLRQYIKKTPDASNPSSGVISNLVRGPSSLLDLNFVLLDGDEDGKLKPENLSPDEASAYNLLDDLHAHLKEKEDRKRKQLEEAQKKAEAEKQPDVRTKAGETKRKEEEEEEKIPGEAEQKKRQVQESRLPSSHQTAPQHIQIAPLHVQTVRQAPRRKTEEKSRYIQKMAPQHAQSAPQRAQAASTSLPPSSGSPARSAAPRADGHRKSPASKSPASTTSPPTNGSSAASSSPPANVRSKSPASTTSPPNNGGSATSSTPPANVHSKSPASTTSPPTNGSPSRSSSPPADGHGSIQPQSTGSNIDAQMHSHEVASMAFKLSMRKGQSQENLRKGPSQENLRNGPSQESLSKTQAQTTQESTGVTAHADPAPSPRSRKDLQRHFFELLDADRDGKLNSKELLVFAILTGFPTDGNLVDRWATKYQGICKKYGCLPSAGISVSNFADVLDDKSEDGCYLDDQRIAMYYELKKRRQKQSTNM